MPVDFLIGGEVTRPHAANLQFANKGRNAISFGDAACSVSRPNENLLQETHSFQVISQFGRRSPSFLHTLNISPPVALDGDTMPDCREAVSPEEHVESRNPKVVNVLNELKLQEVNIKPHLKHALFGVIDRCLDAFAATEDDLGHPAVVEHSINTGDALPIKEKLRSNPQHSRHFAEKEHE